MGKWDLPARRVVTDTELRFNSRHDEKGRFASKGGLTNSAGGGTIDLSKRTEGYNLDSEGKKYIPLDSNGNPYRLAEYYLPPKEYKKVVSSINTNYYKRYNGKKIGAVQNVVRTGNRHIEYNYDFEIHDFNEYNIFDKEKIK